VHDGLDGEIAILFPDFFSSGQVILEGGRVSGVWEEAGGRRDLVGMSASANDSPYIVF
jgi:hypothetical protein